MKTNRNDAPLLFSTGFTLIEILLVVVILGIIAGLAVPNFRSTFTKLTLSETVKDLAYFMRYAQGRATLKGKDHLIELNLTDHTYILKEKKSIDGTSDAGEVFEDIHGRFGGIHRIPADVTVETDTPQIRFYPDGTIDKTRVYLKNERQQSMTISTQEQLGYVRIFDFRLEPSDAKPKE